MSTFNNEEDGKSKCNFKHMNLYDRKLLLEELKAGSNQNTIAQKLGFNKTTISRELLRNRSERHNKSVYFQKRIPCMYVQTCQIHNLCTGKSCTEPCKNCYYGKFCYEHCSEYKTIECKKLEKFPYVCDPCLKKRTCVVRTRYYYVPEEADKKSRDVLVQTRRGIDISEDQFAELDKALTAGTKKGQSVEHIASYLDLPVTARTIRNYMNKGITTTSKAETPRGSTFKPRQKVVNKETLVAIKRSKEGRGYADFLRFAQETSFLFYAEMDTVEGSKKSEDVARLLTIIRPRERLFLCFKVPNGTMKSIIKVFDQLYELLGHEDYTFMFGTLLTDNGTEFCNPMAIETAYSGETRSRVFYCNPYSSWEKGEIENCHELLRRIIPKGSSLKDITDEDTYLINSHINSYVRDANGKESAAVTFVKTFGDRGKRILKKLKVSFIPAEDVTLLPSLISHTKNKK